jgi:hypothetical protein
MNIIKASSVAVLAAGMVGATTLLPAEAAKVYGVHQVTLIRGYV